MNHDHATQMKRYQDLCGDRKFVELCAEKQYSIGESICELAREKGACGIVMGRKEVGTIKRTLFGSVSEYVMENTNSPLVLVPSEKK